MRTSLASIIFTLIILVAGCQNGERESRSTLDHTDVVVEGGGRFPKELVGRWKADRNRWEFEFAGDGSIVDAIHGFGVVRVKPGYRTEAPLKMNGQSVYQSGRWGVQYSPVHRELVVDVVIDHFDWKAGVLHMEGKLRDLFIGTVSEDWSTWTAEWHTMPDYVAYAPDPKRITEKPERNPIATLHFTRAEESQAEEALPEEK